MKLAICGTRTLFIQSSMLDELFIQFNLYPKEIVSGGARGIDSIPEQYGYDKNKNVKIFEADWETYGKSAGPIRNKQIAEYSDALLLIWDGNSKGSANMKSEMEKLNKPIYEVILK